MRTFRLRPPAPSELDIHAACAAALDALLLPPAQWAAYPAGINLGPVERARGARLGLKRGWPDLLLLHRGLYGIELKRDGGRLSQTRIARTRRRAPRILLGQAEMFPLLLASGGFKAIEIARSVEDMLALCERWQIPLRGSAVA